MVNLFPLPARSPAVRSTISGLDVLEESHLCRSVQCRLPEFETVFSVTSVTPTRNPCCQSRIQGYGLVHVYLSSSIDMVTVRAFQRAVDMTSSVRMMGLEFFEGPPQASSGGDA
jgi:hypothetical protein